MLKSGDSQQETEVIMICQKCKAAEKAEDPSKGYRASLNHIPYTKIALVTFDKETGKFLKEPSFDDLINLNEDEKAEFERRSEEAEQAFSMRFSRRSSHDASSNRLILDPIEHLEPAAREQNEFNLFDFVQVRDMGNNQFILAHRFDESQNVEVTLTAREDGKTHWQGLPETVSTLISTKFVA